MTEQEARALKARIIAELPDGYMAVVQTRLFSNAYTVTVMRTPSKKPGLPHRVPGFPEGITSFRQWRANRQKLGLS